MISFRRRSLQAGQEFLGDFFPEQEDLAVRMPQDILPVPGGETGVNTHVRFSHPLFSRDIEFARIKKLLRFAKPERLLRTGTEFCQGQERVKL
jgi:hypothetical protein